MREVSKAPRTFQGDTVLYHPTHGSRLFAQDDQDPGEEWSDAPVAAVEAAAVPVDIQGKIDEALSDQKAKFDKAWGELSAAKKALDDENGDLRGEIASKDEDIRQLKATIAKFDPDGDGKPGGSVAKASK